MHKYLKLLQKDSSIDERNMKTELLMNQRHLRFQGKNVSYLHYRYLLFIIISAYKLIII